MNKNNQRIKVGVSPQSDSFIEINDSSIDFEVGIKLFRKGKEVNRYLEVDKAEKESNSAEVFLKFDNKKRDQFKEDKGSKINVWLKKEAWESEEKWKKNEREACIDYLKKKDVLNTKRDYEDVRFWFTTLSGDRIVLMVKDKNDEQSLEIPIDNHNIKTVEVVSYQITPFTLKDTDKYREVKGSPKEDGPFWTGGKIFLAVVISAILLLLIIFWKKIWRWIKGQSSQEKKVREQIDIF